MSKIFQMSTGQKYFKKSKNVKKPKNISKCQLVKNISKCPNSLCSLAKILLLTPLCRGEWGGGRVLLFKQQEEFPDEEEAEEQ